ncbi:DUF1561 family protein, partial [Leptospira borgpetersenii serovar Balcanica]|uniref:DUF1561 family protein n=1 Tax=Leptospira borgpetersenii TaxID=174 RepID=UPI0018802CF6
MIRLIVVLLVLIGVDFSYGVNSLLIDIVSRSIPGSIIQKPTDTPQDRAIKIVI